jgi:alginate O-acetyltransferase complex protein AlgJ
MFQKQKSNGVHSGHEGWLFWVGQSGEIQALFRNTLAARWRIYRWQRLIERRTRRAAKLGSAFRQVIMPDKLSLCLAKASASLVDPTLSPARRIRRGASTGPAATAFVDIVSAFEAAGEDVVRLFLKTDSHTSYRGYLEAYKSICASCAAKPANSVLTGKIQGSQAILDLGSKFDPPVPEEVFEHYVFPRQATRLEANDLTRVRESQHLSTKGLQIGSRIVFRNSAEEVDPRTLVLFGDSYSFLESGFGAMLAETFREVHLLWSAQIDWSYVERIRPDLLIHEIAERFTRRVPRDQFDIEAFAAKRVRAAAQRGIILPTLAGCPSASPHEG